MGIEQLFILFFVIGVGFVVVSFFVGELVEVEGSNSAFSFFRPTLIAVFLTVTGGLGLLLPRIGFEPGAAIILFISALSGLALAGLINRFIIVPLHKAQNTSTFNMQDTIGCSANVISHIPQGGYGKIKYNISGSVVTSPAKSDDGNEIRAGETVEIMYIEGRTYFVRRQAARVHDEVMQPGAN